MYGYRKDEEERRSRVSPSAETAVELGQLDRYFEITESSGTNALPEPGQCLMKKECGKFQGFWNFA